MLTLCNAPLEGTLPAEYGQLSLMEELDVFGTRISGTIPRSYSSWTALKQLAVYRTELSGTLDPAWATWTHLLTIYLFTTAIGGSIPEELAAWTSLVVLQGMDSALEGTLSPALARWAAMTNVALMGTRISGTLDAALSNWTAMVSFSAHKTRLSGTLPAFAWPAVRAIVLSDTLLSGTVPSLSGMPLLQVLDLSRCRFERLGDVLGQHVGAVFLADNRIAFAREDCPPLGTNIATLDLSGNAWGVNISTAMACVQPQNNTGRLVSLGFNRMRLTGALAYDLSVPIRSGLQALSIEDNLLEAEPGFMGYPILTALTSVSFGGNAAVGSNMDMADSLLQVVNASGTKVRAHACDTAEP
jgi:hypothetical protein